MSRLRRAKRARDTQKRKAKAKRGRKSWARMRGQGMTAYMADGETARVLAWSREG